MKARGQHSRWHVVQNRWKIVFQQLCLLVLRKGSTSLQILEITRKTHPNREHRARIPVIRGCDSDSQVTRSTSWRIDKSRGRKVNDGERRSLSKETRASVAQTIAISDGGLAASWLTGSRYVCRHFASKERCPFGLKCNYWHVQKALGKAVHESVLQAVAATGANFDRHLHIRTARSESGEIWYTAGYLNKTTRRVYYAEGNGWGQRDTVGVWWYPDAVRGHESAASCCLCRDSLEWFTLEASAAYALESL